MKMIFADSCYWIALLNPKDELHELAKRVSGELGQYKIVTTEMVLVEFLNGLSRYAPPLRTQVSETVKRLQSSPNVEIIPQTCLQFRDALEHYGTHSDKEWGVTDCASFLVMKSKGISEALTHDHHFSQAGYLILLKDGKSN